MREARVCVGGHAIAMWSVAEQQKQRFRQILNIKRLALAASCRETSTRSLKARRSTRTRAPTHTFAGPILGARLGKPLFLLPHPFHASHVNAKRHRSIGSYEIQIMLQTRP